jgi:hypothetical protein
MIKTREEWLMLAVEELRPYFIKNKLEIPKAVLVGVFAKAGKAIGQCFSPTCTTDGTIHVFVSATHPNGLATLETLVHELLHAALPDDVKHGAKFKEGMKALGLEGKATATSAGMELRAMLEPLAEKLGDYPNPQLKPKEKTKKEKANAKKTFKLFCPRKRANEKSCILTDKTKDGDYSVTVSRKMLKLAFPICVCGAEMEMEPEDFELYKLGESA